MVAHDLLAHEEPYIEKVNETILLHNFNSFRKCPSIHLNKCGYSAELKLLFNS